MIKFNIIMLILRYLLPLNLPFQTVWTTDNGLREKFYPEKSSTPRKSLPRKKSTPEKIHNFDPIKLILEKLKALTR